MKRAFFTLLALAMTAGAIPARAQFLDQNRADRAAPNTAKDLGAQGPQPAATTQIAVKPFTLVSVEVSGASVPPGLVGAASKPFIGQIIDAAGIKKITDALAAAYAKSDIALYTIVAPEQDFAGGVLKIRVIEGYIENVDLQGDTKGDLDLVKAYAKKLMAERPLRRATLQRYLSLIRDIAGLTVDSQLVTGSAPGATRLVLKLSQKDLLLTLGVNNNGNPLLGRTQLSGSAAFYGLLQEGEQTTVSLGAPTDLSLYQFVSVADAEPIGSEGTMAQMTAGYLHTKPKLVGESGQAESLQMLLAHPLIRSYDESLVVSADLDGLNSNNALLGELLSDERTRAVRLSANYSLTSPKDFINLAVTLSNGLDFLGARIIPNGTAVPDFHKINVSAAYNRLIDPDWVVRLKTAAQLPGNRLPVSELFSLGGPDYGRSFPVATAIGDEALAESVEIAWHPTTFPIGFLKGSEIYGFADRGETWYLSRPPFNSGTVTLGSAGVGTRLAVWKDTSLQLEVAKPLDAPPGFKHGWTFEVGFKSAN
jgi:hemolysin activation/secretion protein